MHALRRFVRFVFGFSRKETNGFILLIPVMVAIIFFPSVYHRLAGAEKDDFSEEARVLDSLVAGWQEQEQKKKDLAAAEEPDEAAGHEPPVARRLAAFDPNVATQQELQTLGCPEWLAARIVRYREKGGKFAIKDDLLKIYGMDSALFRQLRPYIRLPQQRPPAKLFAGNKSRKKEKAAFDINRADTTQLKSVYGIGTVLSSRIVRYRQKLGGFVRRDQLYEVYGLDSAVADRLLEVAFFDPAFVPEKIHLNEAAEEALAGHPYLSKAIARVIVAYRFQHGTFTSVKDIRDIVVINERTFLKIEPYLTVN